MTIAFQCPGCGVTLKVPDTMAGRRGKCPKCGTVNQLPAAGGQLQTAPAAPKPKSAPARPPKPAPEPDVAEDEGEAEDQPAARPRKGKKKRRSRTMLFVGLGCGGALLLLCMGVGAGVGVWWYMSSPISEELTYMPSNCEVLASIRLDQLLDSKAYKQVEQEVPMLKEAAAAGEAEKGIGLQLSNVERIVVGGHLGAGDQPVVAVRTKQPVKAEDMLAKIKGKSFTNKKVGSYTMYEEGGAGFCVVSKKLVLFGPSGGLQSVLARNKKPNFSAGLSAAMKEADFSRTIVIAAAAPKQGGGKPAGNFGGLPISGAALFAGDDDVDGVVLQAKVTADVSLTLMLLCRDPATATVAKRKLDEGLTKAKSMPNVPPELRNALDVKSSASGRKVTLTTDIKVAPMIKAVKNLMPMMK
jgi:hypothetical protein